MVEGPGYFGILAVIEITKCIAILCIGQIKTVAAPVQCFFSMIRVKFFEPVDIVKKRKFAVIGRSIV